MRWPLSLNFKRPQEGAANPSGGFSTSSRGGTFRLEARANAPSSRLFPKVFSWRNAPAFIRYTHNELILNTHEQVVAVREQNRPLRNST